MRNETKIGVVIGLLIVVVASVYFYGSSRVEDDLFVAADPRITPPAKLPMTSERKRAAALDSGASARSSTTAPPAVDPSPYLARPPRSGQPRPSPGRIEPASLAQAPAPRVLDAPPGGRRSVPLRTGASDALTRATQTNLEASDDRPIDARGADLAFIGQQLRGGNGVETGRPPPPAAGSSPQTPSERPVTAPPASPPARQPATPEWPRQHRVETGDTLYRLSQSYYGDGSHTAEILRANPDIKHARGLQIGQVLVIPDPHGPADSADTPAAATAVAAKPPPARPTDAGRGPSPTGTSYTVREGDSFYTIAQRVLGDGRRWEELYNLNKTVVKNNPKRLKHGMVLTLPPR